LCIVKYFGGTLNKNWLNKVKIGIFFILTYLPRFLIFTAFANFYRSKIKIFTEPTVSKKTFFVLKLG
jgi:hypothetical protein